MTGIGTVAVFLLFGIGFAMYAVGTLPGGAHFGTGFEYLWANIETLTVSSIFNMIVAAIVNPVTIASLALAAIVAYANQSAGTAIIRAAVMIAVTNFLFVPFTFAADLASVPIEIQVLIRSFFAVLIMIAVISFSMGQEW